MAWGRLLTAIKGSPLGRGFLNRRVTTMHFGVARGLKRRGGLGMLGLFRSESEETRFIQALDLRGKIVFDLGANFGAFTMYFCKTTGHRGHVYAFDPIPANCASIRENLALNNLTNATVFQYAVGDRSGEISFTLDPGNTSTASGNPQIGNAIEQRTQVQKLTVQQVVLDELVRQGVVPAPDLVKIDVEGMEARVLTGMSDLLKQRAPDLFIEMHGATRDEKLIIAQAVCTTLWDADYTIHHVERNEGVTPESVSSAASGHLYGTPNQKDNSIWKRH